MSLKKRYALGIDVGGTFVDLTLCDLTDGRRWIGKVLSNAGPIPALLSGIRQVCASAGVTLDQIERVVHGLTLATNAILERSERGAVVLTTRGFRDVLEIGRHAAPRHSDSSLWLKPPRLIPRDRIVEVDERIAWDGEIIRPLEDAACAQMVETLRRLSATSVAVSLLYGHIYPAHEQRLTSAIRDALPHVKVSASHEVLPQAGEYERMTATVINAYVKPRVGNYLNELRRQLADEGLDAPLYIMSSDGGVLEAADAGELPIATALSGPAAGASGAARFAVDMGERNIIGLDVGGTSSDVTCIEGGSVDISVDGQVGDCPIALPILDVHTVGAGGGSIATVDGERFTVGPASASARPGPACYGCGGRLPTVTDALLVLGWLPEQLAGGALSLDLEAARVAIGEQIAKPLGIAVDEAARAIIQLANTHMANAIRHVSVERGRDPRDYALFPFGGAGALHAVEVAQLASIPRVVVPPSPGVFSTEGLLAADLRRYYVRSLSTPTLLAASSIAVFEEAFRDLEQEAHRWLDSGVATIGRSIVRMLDVRYVNQGSELLVPIESPVDDEDWVSSVRRAFEAMYATRFRYCLPHASIEVVKIRIAAGGDLSHAPMVSAREVAATDTLRTRPVHFGGQGWIDCTVVDREKLVPGRRLTGPIIVEGYDSTIVLPPGCEGIVHGNGALVIAVGDAADKGDVQ